MNNKKSFALGMAIGAVVVLIISLWVGNYQRQRSWGGRPDPNSKLMEIYDLLNEISIFPLDKDQMLENMYRGFLDGVGDPYTQYFDRNAAATFMERQTGVYVGIGILVLVDQETRAVTVANTFRDTPAHRAGILPGDVIYRVEDIDAIGLSLEEVAGMIRGPVNTVVNITIFRPYEDEYIELTLIRERVTVPSVFHEMMDGLTGYIRIESFDSATTTQFSAAMADLTGQGMTGLILDLRNNPGGSLDAVAFVADYFIPEGISAFIVDANDDRRNLYTDENYFGQPLVVLVNNRSASASELLSGAIQDTGVGIVIGEQTFGKGIVQHFRRLSDGSAIKATVAQYFTPSGTVIHGEGVTPDVEVEMDEATSRMIGNLELDDDIQLRTAFEMIREMSE